MDRTPTHPDHVPATAVPGGSRTAISPSGDALARLERHLRVLIHGCERATLDRWQATCRHLAQASLTSPGQVKPWLRQLAPAEADAVLGQLVRHAQRGDPAALLVVLVCLAPGVRSLVARTGVTLDEAVSEVALGVLGYPVDRRSSIAGGLLLDARNRIYRAARRDSRTDPLDDAVVHPAASGELGTVVPPAQRIVQLVCQAHREGLLDHTEARLILETRLGGHKVRPVADGLGLTPSAAYQRRSRAEARLVQVA